MRTQARRRIKIGPGQWREGDRLWAEVRIGNWRDTDTPQGRALQDFPLGTDPRKLTIWQTETRAKLLKAQPVGPSAGSFAADVEIYLVTLPAGRYHDDSADLLAHWAAPAVVGDRPRADVDRLDVISQIAKWLDAGVSVSACNKRLSRLRKLYEGLDGITTPNPTDKIKFLKEPEYDPRDLPIHIVKLILASLPDRGRAVRGGKRPTVSETKIRLTVMAWTGIPPATLRRLRFPKDIDFVRGRVYLRPRRKAHGAPGVWIGLIPEAIDAFRQFVAAGLVGKSWARSSMRKTFHVGIKRARAAAVAHEKATGDESWRVELDAVPANCRPYDLRHTFATEMYRRTGKLEVVQELLQHANLETTKHYAKSAVSERVTAAIATVGSMVADAPTLPTPAAHAKAKKRAALTVVARRSAS